MDEGKFVRKYANLLNSHPGSCFPQFTADLPGPVDGEGQPVRTADKRQYEEAVGKYVRKLSGVLEKRFAKEYEGDEEGLRVRCHHHMIDSLYQALSIIDQKSNTILAVNAIIFAINIFISQETPKISAPWVPYVISLIFAVSLLFLLISMYNLARISFVKWTSAADIEAGLPPYNLIYLRAERTIILRYSIVLSSISFIATLVIGALIYILSFPAGAVQPCP